MTHRIRRAFFLAAVLLTITIGALITMPVTQAAPPAKPLVAPGDCTVITTTDSISGSLRTCILGLQPGATITFALTAFPPLTAGVIVPATPLPNITTDNVTIDGSSAGVILDGSSLSSGHGLVIDGASGVTIKGLQILNFPDDGVRLQNGATNNLIGGSNATPGGACTDDCNLISGNGDFPGDAGVKISDSGTVSNTISGNYIGTDATGNASFPNHSGLILWFGASNNTIGGSTPGERNLISGNIPQHGIAIQNSGTNGNIISGNYIGTNTQGTGPLGNTTGSGIDLFGGAQTNIITGNLISGNGRAGIDIRDSGTTGNIIRGNYIGTDVSGTTAISNDWVGVAIQWGASNNTIGGSNPVPGGNCAGDCNLISGNSSDGVMLDSTGTMSNTVSGNYIGTDVAGAAALGNDGVGIWIANGASNNTIGGSNATPGGNCTGACNLVSGNLDRGIEIDGSGTMNNIVAGNYIGTTASGAGAIPNLNSGLKIEHGASHNIIGGSTPNERNLISGNANAGIELDNSGTMSNTVQGNYIGVTANGSSALSNQSDGIWVAGGAQYNNIGGSNTGEGNLISGNSAAGVALRGFGVQSDSPLLDDISLSFNGGPNQLTNGDFSGSLLHWGTDDDDPVSSRSLNTTDFRSAPASYQFNRNGAVGDLNTFYDTIARTVIITDAGYYTSSIYLPTTPGTNVTLTFWYKGSLFEAAIWSHDGVQDDDFAGSYNLPYAPTWTQVVVTSTVPAGVDRVGVRFVVESGPQTAHNTVQGNRIGTDASGTAALGNGDSGVRIENSAQDNTVGGSNATPGGACSGECNLISGNGNVGQWATGVTLQDTGTSNNRVSGNYIGVNLTGTAALGNTGDGIGLRDGSSVNTIGGSGSGEGNLVSGNGVGFTGVHGVRIQGDTSIVTGNVVIGNLVGTDATGTQTIPNAETGIQIQFKAKNNRVGGLGSGEENIISGNGTFTHTASGLWLNGIDATGNMIEGNHIGTDISGLFALGNTAHGVGIAGGANNNRIGPNNLISGNHGQGVSINDSGTNYNIVSGNYIGTNISGTASISNALDGIAISNGPQFNTIGGSNTTSGANCSGDCNLISSNGDEGIQIGGSGTLSNTVSGNFIGTDISGTSALGNMGQGILLWGGAQYHLIGGDTSDKRNLISGNNPGGVAFDNSGTMNNTLRKNYIGVDVSGTTDLGNFGFGIVFAAGASNNLAEGNIVAHSKYFDDQISGAGIHILDQASSNNTFSQNLIFNNDDKGILLASGGNGGINRPVLTAVSPASVQGTAKANSLIEIFSDDEDEGRYFHGSTTAGADGKFSFSGPFTGSNVTATATDANGNTSEFSVRLSGTGAFAENGQSSLGNLSSQAVALGDLDGDGDQDAFVANASPNEVWLNDGEGNFSDDGQDLGDASSQAVDLGDLDGDGDLDAVVGNASGENSEVWENDGSGTFNQGSGSPASSGDTQAVVLGDLDGDGDLDAFAGNGSNQANEIWLNDGQGQLTASPAQGLVLSDTQAVALEDLDGDGDLDAYVANGSGQPDQVWFNNGSGTFTVVQSSLGNLNSQGVALGDIDGDGHPDAFVVSGDSGEPGVVWLNNGSGQFTISQTVSISGSNAVALGDLDGDGDLDAVVGSEAGQANQVLINDGSGSFTIVPIPANSGADSQAVALADLDNDGDLDIFIGNSDDGNDPGNQVLINLNSRPDTTGPDGGMLNFTQGLTLTLDVPAGALSGVTTFVYTPTQTAQNVPANLQFAGRAFSLVGQSIFSKPVTATVYFNPAALQSNQPRLHYWDTSASNWKDVTCTCDAACPDTYRYGSSWLKVAFCHLTDFGLFEAAGGSSGVYLPLILK